MSIPVEEFDKWHTCGAPGCTRRVKKYYFACGQHRGILGWDLNCRLQTDWRERQFDPDRWERTRTEAFRKWGWKPEQATCQTPS